jgi:hypothetical protein
MAQQPAHIGNRKNRLLFACRLLPSLHCLFGSKAAATAITFSAAFMSIGTCWLGSMFGWNLCCTGLLTAINMDWERGPVHAWQQRHVLGATHPLQDASS